MSERTLGQICREARDAYIKALPYNEPWTPAQSAAAWDAAAQAVKTEVERRERAQWDDSQRQRNR